MITTCRQAGRRNRRTVPPGARVGGAPTRARGLRALCAGLLLEGLLLGILAACTSFSEASAQGGAGGSAGATGSAGTPGAPGTSGQPGQAGQPGQPGRPGGVSMVSCSNDSCTVTLGGSGTAQALDTAFAIREIRGDRATVRVGDRDVVLVRGQAATAGPLTLRCTAVTSDTVTFTVTPG